MNFQAMTVLTFLIWFFLVLWIVFQHFQLLSGRREMLAEQARIRDLARLQTELRDRVQLQDETARQLNEQHATALLNLEDANRSVSDTKSQLQGAQVQVRQLEQSLSHSQSVHAQTQSQMDTLKLEHAQMLRDKEADYHQQQQAQLVLMEQKINEMNQQTKLIDAQLQQSQAAFHSSQRELSQGAQSLGECQRKVEQLEASHREVNEQFKKQLILTQQGEATLQKASQELAHTHARLTQLQTENHQLQQAHRQSQEAWQQEKSTWVKTLEQQQMVHQGQLQELTQSHQTGLHQAVSAAAQELQSLEKSLFEKMQGMAQTHAQEHARSQNELSSLRQQFQAINQSRAELESQLHASNHQKQTVHDKVMDFEKRWSQIAHEQQQAHEMLLNLKSLVLASSSGSVS